MVGIGYMKSVPGSRVMEAESNQFKSGCVGYVDEKNEKHERD